MRWHLVDGIYSATKSIELDVFEHPNFQQIERLASTLSVPVEQLLVIE